MSSSSGSWLSAVKQARKTALMQDGRIKVHFVFPDGREMAEEYNDATQELLVRKWRAKRVLGGEGHWEIEVGEESTLTAAQRATASSEHLVESSSTPFVTRRDHIKSFEWRIRNLPYPADVYSVTAEPEKSVLVVRTSNKKYFKRITVADLERLGCQAEQGSVSFVYANNTLIITYRKPRAVLDLQRTVFLQVKELLKGSKDGDAATNCTQS